MKWSWHIGSFRGIGIYVHGTFLILLAWVAVSHVLQKHGIADVLEGLLFTVTIFGIVILHELGHAVTAQRFGIRTKDITLLPIGGVARLERMAEDPKHELLVALAGPAVNIALAAILFVVLTANGEGAPLDGLNLVGGSFLAKLLWVNVAMAAFNLVPAFPMDGGRVLRSVLATRMDYVRATQIAANVGQTLAFVFGGLGLFSNPFLVFIALFVWIAAADEADAVEMKSALRGVPIARTMITDFRTLSPHDLLTRAVDYLVEGFQEDFPVVQDGRVVGILMGGDLISALARRGGDTKVAEVMQQQFLTAHPADMAESVFARLQGHACHALPIVRDGRLVGLVTMSNVGEFVAIHRALQSRADGSAPGRSDRQLGQLAPASSVSA